MSSRKVCTAVYLGLVPYERALELQQFLLQARTGGNIPDVLLLLQHPPVFTVGRFRGEEDILVPSGMLAEKGIAVFPTDRGGSITYHGPGQLVGYPILNLKEKKLSVREYIWKLEEVIIRLLQDIGIQSHRATRYPGSVWVRKQKVCSIGIRVSRYITMHGFALNINNDLSYFKYIRPCGLQSEVMTSVSQLLGHTVEVETLVAKLPSFFSEVLELNCETGEGKWQAILDGLNGSD